MLPYLAPIFIPFPCGCSGRYFDSQKTENSIFPALNHLAKNSIPLRAPETIFKSERLEEFIFVHGGAPPPVTRLAIIAAAESWLLVQRESLRGTRPIITIPPFGRGFSRHGVFRSDEVFGKRGLSLGMVASRQSPLPFCPATLF